MNTVLVGLGALVFGSASGTLIGEGLKKPSAFLVGLGIAVFLVWMPILDALIRHS